VPGQARSPLTVVLVRGAWHDSSCWDPLRAELESRGLRTVAPDLPSDPARSRRGGVRPGGRGRDGRGRPGRTDPTRTNPGRGHGRVTGARDRPRAAGRALARRAHGARGGPAARSGAGVRPGAGRRAAPGPGAVLERPGPGGSDHDGAGLRRGRGAAGGRHRGLDGEAARAGLYRDVAEESSAELVGTAVAGLRPQAWAVGMRSRRFVWPAVRTVSMVCAEDRVVSPAWSPRAAVALGADVVDLAGGHFPMLTRPAEPAEILARIASGAGA
jgi:hypothetical protein